jgi:hypothetical protein
MVIENRNESPSDSPLAKTVSAKKNNYKFRINNKLKNNTGVFMLRKDYVLCHLMEKTNLKLIGREDRVIIDLEKPSNDNLLSKALNVQRIRDKKCSFEYSLPKLSKREILIKNKSYHEKLFDYKKLASLNKMLRKEKESQKMISSSIDIQDKIIKINPLEDTLQHKLKMKNDVFDKELSLYIEMKNSKKLRTFTISKIKKTHEFPLLLNGFNLKFCKTQYIRNYSKDNLFKTGINFRRSDLTNSKDTSRLQLHPLIKSHHEEIQSTPYHNIETKGTSGW